MQLCPALFIVVRKVELKTLDVEPSMPFEVEDFAVSFVNLSVAMRPYTRVSKSEQRVHTSAKKVRVVFMLQEVIESKDRFLHVLLELDWRSKRRVGFDFHDVQLKFFPKREMRLLDKVDDTTVKILQNLVNDRQHFQFIVDQ
jgi:hypothetical protein